MWVVVGLGNPGKKYAETRHNIGFIFIERIAADWGVRLKRKRKYLSKAAYVKRGQEGVLLAVPWTYMNRSGEAAKQILERTGVKQDRLLVVYDDLDIPLGEVRIKKSGGPGTHNGMGSIVEEIQSIQFPRIRIGIGPLSLDVDATDYVLSPFRKNERVKLKESLAQAREALDLILGDDIEKAMNLYN